MRDAWWRELGPATLRADLMAGLVGAVLVLPQGIAFATLAGLPPQYGIYAAVVPCIVAALFGSSRHVVCGPTNANSLALFAMLSPLAAVYSPQYVALALAVTLLVGILQLALGVFRLGAVANFISPTVLLGFTAGAAALIAIHAMKDLLGLALPAGTRTLDLLAHLADVAWRLPEGIDPLALAVGVVTMVAAIAARHVNPRAPYLLLGLAAGTLLAWAATHPTLQEHFPAALRHAIATVGPIPGALPPLSLPRLDWSRLPDLLGIAGALTIVALGQDISIAKAIAQRSGQRIDANREFVGQGLSNVAGSFFSAYISCGSLNRSLPNYEAGARTPLAAVFSALLLVVLVAFTAPLLAAIPLAAVAGSLLVVAWSLFDLGRFRKLGAVSRAELGIAATTFVATVTMRLELAIFFGALLSLVAYLYRTSRPNMRVLVPDIESPDRRFTPLEELTHPARECPQLKLVRMEGSVYFAAAQHVGDTLQDFRRRHPGQKHLLVMAKSMNFIDVSGAQVWEAELRERRAMGADLYFHRPRPQVLDLWRQAGFIDRLGADHIFPSKRAAIASIYARMDAEGCRGCEARLFEECPARATGGAITPARG
jgi:SulP family sulfate permease